MLSLPDFKEKKIVFLQPEGDFENSIKLQTNNIALYKDGKLVNKIPCHMVFCLFIIGDCTITTKLIKKLKDYGISIFLLNYSFQIYADIMSQAEGNYKLRHIQYNLSEDRALELSKIIVKNKIENQYKLLKQYKNEFDKNILGNTLKQIESTTNLNSLLGLEGNFSSNYFKNIFKDLKWYRRAPRSKEDIPNYLLDIGYTYMFNYIDALLRLFGFDTYKGFYHQLFFQRKSLSCDMMEPFRCLIDKQLIKSYNLGQIDEADFEYKNGSFKFKNYDVSKKYLTIFFEMIMAEREEIYSYVLDFYRYFQCPDDYPLPEYKLS